MITTKSAALDNTASGGDFYHDSTNKLLNVRIDGKKLGNFIIKGIVKGSGALNIIDTTTNINST